MVYEGSIERSKQGYEKGDRGRRDGRAGSVVAMSVRRASVILKEW